jgi:threonine synthase
MASTITHLECSRPTCKTIFDHTQRQHLCATCHAPLLARYDLDAARRTFTRAALATRVHSMWRYEEVLPSGPPVTLGEGATPLIHARRLGAHLGLERLYIKEEGQNPTASFKARGLSAAVTVARSLGVDTIALPTAGNAGGAAAAYAAHAGLHCVVAMPADTPAAIVLETRACGADVRLINGLISDCGAFIAEQAPKHGWYEVSTLKEPYRIEGKKTMGYELWEEFDTEGYDAALPDVIVYPTGGGVGLIGMWKAFEELEAMNLTGRARPRMIAAQAEGCAPIVKAFEQHASASVKWENATTVAAGLRVPKALGDFIILADIYESQGEAIAVSDEALMSSCHDMARFEGILAAPEGGAGLAAIQTLIAQRKIRRDESVVLFNTGSGYKYLEAWQGSLRT